MTQETVRKVPCEVYSRVVGYLRPVIYWNEGKKQEFADRTPYKLQGKVADSPGKNGTQRQILAEREG